MIGILSDIGNVRKINEDSVGYYESDTWGIYIIADGMGCHNAGEVASALAVETTLSYIKQTFHKEDIPVEKLLKRSITVSNEKIYDFAKQSANYSGMGTTVTACLIDEKSIFIANVGDSSCYIIAHGDIVKITKDHSLVQQLVDNGTITPEEAHCHPNKNVITRALGTNPIVETDIFKLNKEGISKIILCTDGLTNELKIKEIYDIVTQNENEAACKKLIEKSKANGGRDNISVIVIEGECKNDRNFARE